MNHKTLLRPFVFAWRFFHEKNCGPMFPIGIEGTRANEGLSTAPPVRKWRIRRMNQAIARKATLGRHRPLKCSRRHPATSSIEANTTLSTASLNTSSFRFGEVSVVNYLFSDASSPGLKLPGSLEGIASDLSPQIGRAHV